MSEAGPDGRAGIDAALVRRLVAAQHPQWAGLPVRPVQADGWDNRTYRLGERLSVRLPTAAGYVPAVAKEDRWLPVLAPHLPLPVPTAVARGVPGEGYPYPWSVRHWLPGAPATRAGVEDLTRFALDLAGFLGTLWSLRDTGGPAAGEHSFWRGASPAAYDGETRQALDRLVGRLDTAHAAAVWQVALDAPDPRGRAGWFHGDVAPGNLLVRDGRLAAVIDFGTSGVGDPACDLVLAWTFLDGKARTAFREAVEQPEETWARARGWALWKSLITLAATDNPSIHAAERRVVAEVLADHDT